MLDDVINTYVEKEVRQRQDLGLPTTPEATQKLRELIRKQVVEDAFNEMKTEKLEDLNNTIKEKEKLALEKAKLKLTKFKMKQISGIISETIFLALFIGLLVNQITNWIDSGLTLTSAIVIAVCIAAVILLRHLLSTSKFREGEDGHDGI